MLTELRGLNEECGVFGVWNHPRAAQITYYALHSLQHRGQEGAGIVVTDGETLRIRKGQGLVTDVFSAECMEKLQGSHAIGHVRYSIGGVNGFENVQPLLFRSQNGDLAIAHNGSLTNAYDLRVVLEEEGSIFQTAADAEILAHLAKRRGTGDSFADRMMTALRQLEGSYAFVILTEDALYVALDPYGLKPLALGSLGEGYVVASETCAFDLIGAKYLRDVKPGEFITIDARGVRGQIFSEPRRQALCSMEYIYFSRPDSNLWGMNVHTARKKLGKALAREYPIDADVVTGVPDSSLSAAIGYAEVTGIPYELGLIKSRYIGRTFIEPSQSLREQGVKLKLSAVRGVVEGKRVVMVDDSCVRGTTSRRITSLLREAGATEVHVLIASPTIQHPCYYGMDTLSTDELVAAHHDVEEMRVLIGADSLGFLSVEKMAEVFDCGLCLACFTGEYPTGEVEASVRCLQASGS
ncbi:MAG: amidophosphoribosyltransferase [Firmicutes bacterium]|nr:amidophosphoribosyltransferase [Bacillota bacterium]